MFGVSVTLDLSIQSHPLGAQYLAVLPRPNQGLPGPADFACPYRHRLDLHHSPKPASFDMEMRRQVIIGIDGDLTGSEAADGGHGFGLRKAMVAALSRARDRGRPARKRPRRPRSGSA